MFIAVEGCIGAGKSTVARGLAAHRGSAALLEDFEANPFLASFSDNPSGNAAETEFGFLLIHYHQLKAIPGAGGEMVADFHLGKDPIYADLNLPDSQWKACFSSVYRLCQSLVPRPDLLIYLSAEVETLAARIARRGRAVETGLPQDYLDRLNRAYEVYFRDYSGRKLRLAVAEWDFVAAPALFSKLSSLADEALGAR